MSTTNVISPFIVRDLNRINGSIRVILNFLVGKPIVFPINFLFFHKYRISSLKYVNKYARLDVTFFSKISFCDPGIFWSKWL
jgi:hypothetical protein